MAEKEAGDERTSNAVQGRKRTVDRWIDRPGNLVGTVQITGGGERNTGREQGSPTTGRTSHVHHLSRHPGRQKVCGPVW